MLLKVENNLFEIECTLPSGEHYAELGFSGEIKEINGEDEGWFISGIPVLKNKKGNGVYVRDYEALVTKLNDSSFWCLEITNEIT